MAKGKKLDAWKLIIAGLRDSVRTSKKRPQLGPLKALQETFLLDEKKITRYVLQKESSIKLDARSRALVDFLLDVTKYKPQKYTMEELLVMQRICLPTDIRIIANVIFWWIKNRKKLQSNEEKKNG